MFFSYSSRTVCTEIYLKIHPGLAKIAGVSEGAETYSCVASSSQALTAMGTGHLAASVRRALLCNDNKSNGSMDRVRQRRWIRLRNRVSAQEIFDKIDVNSEALSVYYVVGKYRPVQSFGFSRVRVDSIAGVNIWRKYSFATILFCRSFDLVLSRFLSILTTVGNGNWWDVCEIIFRRARSSTLSEISDEWKGLSFSSFFPSFFFFFFFFVLSGSRVAAETKLEDSWKIDATLVDFSIDERRKYWWCSARSWQDFNRVAFVAFRFPKFAWRNLAMNK